MDSSLPLTVRITLTCRTSPDINACVILQKEPGNTFDNEAIAVKLSETSTPVGYVAATYKTRKLGTVSAGRIYDRFDKSIVATVIQNNIAEVTFP